VHYGKYIDKNQEIGTGEEVIQKLGGCREYQEFFGEIGWELDDKGGRPAHGYEGMRYAPAMCARELAALYVESERPSPEGHSMIDDRFQARPVTRDRSCGPPPTHVYSMLHVVWRSIILQTQIDGGISPASRAS